MARKRRAEIEIQGETPEKKFAHTEKILQRMARRMNQRVVGVIPPSIIMHYVQNLNEDNVIIKGILPAGTITKVCVGVGKYRTKKLARFHCKITDQSGAEQGFTFETKRSVAQQEMEIAVPNLGFFEIFVDAADDIAGAPIEDVWLTILFQTSRSDEQLREYMMDDLERMDESEILEITNEGI